MLIFYENVLNMEAAWRPLAEKGTGRKPGKDGITYLCIIS